MTPPREIEADQSVAEAIQRLRDLRTGCLLITRHGQLVGIFTERDLLGNVLAVGLPLQSSIAEVMTPNPVSVREKDPIQLVVQKMQVGGYRHLPVVNAENRPVGIVSVKQIVRYLVEHFPSTVYNQPPHSENYPSTAEGA
jgi:CBS domain-containing protein